MAATGQTLNVADVGCDERFNDKIDQQVRGESYHSYHSVSPSLQTGYKTKSILCMPISIQGVIIGVMQMVNKVGEASFSAEDEEAFRLFSVYCGLALHYAKLYDKIRRSEQKLKVTLEVLAYHSSATAHDVEEVEQIQKISTPINVRALAAYGESL